MSNEPCPVCKGKCCRDQEFGYRIYHMASSYYEHWCDDCYNGIKYVTPKTYEQGITEGKRLATVSIIKYLRTRPGYGPIADAIECGEHIAAAGGN
jgi:hypothetical protein